MGPLETRGGNPALESHQGIQLFSMVWLSHITEGLLAVRSNITDKINLLLVGLSYGSKLSIFCGGSSIKGWF